MKYTWQQVAIDGRLFSTARGLFDTTAEALAYWHQTPETATWTESGSNVLVVAYAHYHLTMIEVS